MDNVTLGIIAILMLWLTAPATWFTMGRTEDKEDQSITTQEYLCCNLEDQKAVQKKEKNS